MRSTIDTLDLTDLEKEFIEDYFKYIHHKINYPTHPEIVIGNVRYPVGRLVLKPNLTKEFVFRRRRNLEKRRESFVKNKMIHFLDNLDKVLVLTKEVKDKGKTVKKEKRKNESKNQSA